MTLDDIERLDWEKTGELIPAIIQNDETGQVLMLGFMNRESLRKTLESGKVTFWSRSRKQLWTKGETSGNYLHFKSARIDCDRDTLLVRALPTGPVCHRGTTTCFEDRTIREGDSFLFHLEQLIRNRREERPEGSYTTELFNRGLDQISKKLGEEAVEVVVSAHQERKRSVEESADLILSLIHI